MPLNERELQRRFDAKNSQVLNTVCTYRHLAPAAMAAQERLSESLSHSAQLGDASVRPDRQPGVVRCALGRGFVRLGAWLAGLDAARPAGERATPAT